MEKTGNEIEDLIAVGKIVNTHGHKGDVKVIPLTDNPERLEELKKVIISNGNNLKEFNITSVRYHKNFAILAFAEIENMNEAEKLKESLMLIPKNEAKKLPEGSYYIFDIIGLEVKSTDGRRLGKIVDVFQTGANDVYDVEDQESGKHYLIPAIKQIVKNISLEVGEMIIEPMEGLLD